MFVSESAQAQAPLYLDNPCLLASQNNLSAEKLIATPSDFNCHINPSGFAGPVTWAYFGQLNLPNKTGTALLFRNSQHQVQDESVFVRYANGKVAQASMGLRRRDIPITSGVTSFRLPEASSPITAILVREVGMQNERGPAPNATIMSTEMGQQQDASLMLIFAMLGGALLTLFAYNFALFIMLRYKFILAYCATAILTFAFGVGWAGGYLYLWPSLKMIEGLNLTLLILPIYILAIVLFMLSFIERGKVSAPLIASVLLMPLVAIAVSIIRVVDVTFAWQAIDNIYYGTISLALLMMISCSYQAYRNGSRVAHYHLLIWLAPFCSGLLRIVYGLGLIHKSSLTAEIGPLFVLTFEACASAIAVSWRIGQLRKERDIARANETIMQELAMYDSMTGLLNRRALLQAILGKDTLLALILIDIDNFKSINDTFGHSFGDEVLCSVAQILRDATPENAHVSRVGGEEFAVVLPFHQALGIAERLRDSVTYIDLPDDKSISVSMGVAVGQLLTEADWRILYSAADEALYQAKHDGKNCVRSHPTLRAA